MEPVIESVLNRMAQDELVRAMEEFCQDNPAVAEAMRVMNMSVADYLAAMEAVKGVQTFYASASIDMPSCMEP